MAIPTKEEFDSWLSRARTPIDVGVRLPEALTVESIASYLREAEAGRWSTWESLLHETRPMQWLIGQREFLRAKERTFSNRRRSKEPKPALPPRRAEDVAARFLERAAEREARAAERDARQIGSRYSSRESREADLRNEIERDARYGFEGTWTYGTVRAIAEYLEGKAANRFTDAVREIDDAAEAANAAVERFNQLVAELNSPAFRDIPPNRNRIRTDSRPYFATAYLGVISPLGRKDARVSERLFVYRMFVLNRRWTRSAKAEAIADLMGLEGFRHQYDLRTIERLCSRFAEQIQESRRPAGAGN